MVLSLAYRIEQDSVVLLCTTAGMPATAALWSKDGILTSLNETYSQYLYTTTQTLTDARTVSYSNTLEINLHRREADGLYGCDIYSDWMTADFTRTGRERKPVVNHS